MGKKLDRTKSFGEIFGGSNEARYTQDGVLFDAHGDEIGAETVPVKPQAKGKGKTPPKAEAPAPAPTTVDAQVDAFLGEGDAK